MQRLVLSLVLLVMAGAACAQLRPPERTLHPVTDPSMVVMDRGAKLEVFPDKRATPRADVAGGGSSHHVTTASADAPIGPQQLGVVFNHAMQQQGYITGEITFKVKGGHAFSDSSTSYPGLKLIVAPATYVVTARTPTEFIDVLKRLQARPDLEWVEPTVTYGPAENAPQIR
jgi:hypothetical protein